MRLPDVFRLVQDWLKWAASGLAQVGQQVGGDGDVPDACPGLGCLDGAAPGLFGTLDVQDGVFKVNVTPLQGGSFARPETAKQQQLDPKAAVVLAPVGYGQDGRTLLGGDAPVRALGRPGKR